MDGVTIFMDKMYIYGRSDGSEMDAPRASRGSAFYQFCKPFLLSNYSLFKGQDQPTSTCPFT